jgi:hypothetical protein
LISAPRLKWDFVVRGCEGLQTQKLRDVRGKRLSQRVKRGFDLF